MNMDSRLQIVEIYKILWNGDGMSLWYFLTVYPFLSFSSSSGRLERYDYTVHWVDQNIEGWRVNKPRWCFRVSRIMNTVNVGAILLLEIWNRTHFFFSYN